MGIPAHMSLASWPATGAAMGKGSGSQDVPLGLRPRGWGDWLREQSFTSWSNRSWQSLGLRGELRSRWMGRFEGWSGVCRLQGLLGGLGRRPAYRSLSC